EPFLLRTGLVQRTRGGRRATPASYRHLGLALPKGSPQGEAQPGLWTGEEAPGG
ncbi:MAG: Holliday junction branch migration DNA helicase RuvB, partial [Candidatus Tectomicrobia bacterium]|nr:Holliday junction branch migration DNA helicase RuvB [Candidatus Tectomicrobia bacterium]